MIKAEIITIGDEILIGQIVDTNSVYIAEELNKIGIDVYQITSVSDKSEHIKKALSKGLQESDILIITGGLGPTKDDITKQVLADFFSAKKMILHQESFKYIKSFFEKRGLPLTDLNTSQAMVPDTCEVIVNKKGTAPGMWFTQGKKVVVSMPGVPYEMTGMLPEVLEKIKKSFQLDSICHKTAMTYGIPESFLAKQIETWEDNLPRNMKLAYLPNLSTGVKLRITAKEDGNKKNLPEQVNKQFELLKQLLGNAIYGYEPDTLQSVIGQLLIKTNASLSTAESCTGGKIASMLTSVAGSSAYFKGSVVSYANEIKENILEVNASDLEKFGAVSEEVVKQMALGVKEKLNTTYSIATSGVAGPNGGSEEKPVGTVWIAIARPDNFVEAKKFMFTGDRINNIIRASATALNMLRLHLIK